MGRELLSYRPPNPVGSSLLLPPPPLRIAIGGAILFASAFHGALLLISSIIPHSQCYAPGVRREGGGMEGLWERGRQAMRQSLELAGTGKHEQALNLLDGALAQATEENRGIWVAILCRHAAVLAHAVGDRHREIRYAEEALPYAKDYRFAIYNFAQLLLRDGQVDLAQKYASEAYSLSIAEGTDADRDLAAAILKQWPDIAENR